MTPNELPQVVDLPPLPDSFAHVCNDGYWLLRVNGTERFDVHDTRSGSAAQDVYSAAQMRERDAMWMQRLSTLTAQGGEAPKPLVAARETEDDGAAIMGRLARALAKANPTSHLPRMAFDWLRSQGMHWKSHCPLPEDLLAPATAALSGELYGDGSALCQMHPEYATNAEIVISALCARLDTARQALAAAAAMQVVDPTLQKIKANAAWAMDETKPSRFAPRSSTIYTTPPAPSSSAADDGELPGMWSHSDFTGGDPDERSYAERKASSSAVEGLVRKWELRAETAKNRGELATFHVAHAYARELKDALASTAASDPWNAIAADEAERQQYERDKLNPENCLSTAASGGEKLSEHGRKALGRCIEEMRTLAEQAQDYGFDEMTVAAFETAIESMQIRLTTAAPAMPDGFVMMPRKPTPEILAHAWGHRLETKRKHYAAMLAAASAQGDGDG